MEDLNNKLNNLADNIKELVSEYNKLTKENDCGNFIIYSEVEELAYNWYADGPTHIADIAESYSENPAWYSSSWCPRGDF